MARFRIRVTRDDGATTLYAHDEHGVDWIVFPSRDEAEKRAAGLRRIWGRAHPDGRGDGSPFYRYEVEDAP